jgi:solute carrier family 25 S-adenosylmethionine transporter 26
MTYEYAKEWGLRATGGENKDAVYFAAGASSELFASLVFVPLEVVKSRLQLGDNPRRATGGVVASETNFPSIRAALRGIYAERGVAGLTAGWKAGFVQDVVFSALQFVVYENTKAAFERRSGRPASSVELLVCGGLGGGLAAAVTNPFDVVTSRLMVQDSRAGYGQTMMSVASATAREGPGALWRGTLPRVAQIAPLSAIAFAVYEGLRGWFKTSGVLRGAAEGENPFAGGG